MEQGAFCKTREIFTQFKNVKNASIFVSLFGKCGNSAEDCAIIGKFQLINYLQPFYIIHSSVFDG